MHAKILRPKTAGKLVYANTGSARRMTNYLQQEAKENGHEAVFFGTLGKGAYTADEVVALLDNNHRGLGKDAEKFHSLVFSPSSEEAGRLGSEPNAWQQYTRQAMELYAKNFKLKAGRELGEEDLVWAATIHQQRKNRGTDAGPQREQKPGNQTHVHLLVSARDAAQQITLNPNTRPSRFNRVEFHAKTNVLLDEQLGRVVVTEVGAPVTSRAQRVAEKATDIKARAAANRKPLTPEQVAAKDARLDGQVARVNTKRGMDSQLEVELVKAIAKERRYDNTFYNALGKIERNAEQGTFTPEPYAYLRSGRVQQSGTIDELSAPQPQPLIRPVPARKEHPVLPTAFQALERSIQELSLALAAAPPQVSRAAMPSKAGNSPAVPVPFLTAPSLLPLEAVPVPAAPAPQVSVVPATEPAPAVPATSSTPVVQATEPVPAVQATEPTPAVQSVEPTSPVVQTVDLHSIVRAIELTPAVAPPAKEKPLTVEEHRALWEAEMEAEAQMAFWDAAWDVRMELEEKTRAQVATASAAAQRTGASFEFLLAGQGLELVMEEAGSLVGVRHQASGEVFSLEEVPVPAAARAVVGQAEVQYGSIHLPKNAESSGAERLAHWQAVLAQAGVLVGQVVPAAPGQLARLDYCFPVSQLNLQAVALQLGVLQDCEHARIYEAPHPLHALNTSASGHTVPRSRWKEREGQFNQARIVVSGTDAASEKTAEIIRRELRKDGASVSAATHDGQGNLALQVTFHTCSDKIEQLNATLSGAGLMKGVELRETKQQRVDRYRGAQSKQVEPDSPSIFQRGI